MIARPATSLIAGLRHATRAHTRAHTHAGGTACAGGRRFTLASGARSTPYPLSIPPGQDGASCWANGPGAGKGRDWDKPNGKYAVAQLSPWVLWPPDGLNLAQGTCGELFGYGYLPLPLTEPKDTTDGHPVPTGNQCWTLFLNTALR